MTHAQTTAYGFLGTRVRFLLAAFMLVAFAGFSVGFTNAAFQATASIEGNSITTGEWESATTTSETIVVAGDTAAGENHPGWLFNRDADTQSPYEFNDDVAKIGTGALFVEPIANAINGDDDKFIGELFLLEPIADFTKISYDFNIVAHTAADAAHFYMNVYANFGDSSSTKYYDCRYDIVPASGLISDWTTMTFDPTQSYPVTQHGSATHTCPPVPADMDAESASSSIRAIAISVGDTSASDLGVSGYFDNVVIERVGGTTVYDFEPENLTVSSETIMISPDDMRGWVFAPENTPTGSTGNSTGELADGPSTPPLGTGSAHFTLTASNEGHILVTNAYAGERLVDISDLRYSTYRTSSADPAQTPALAFEFDNDVTDSDTDWRGRMVYEPYHAHTVQTGVWQEWNTLDNTPAGNWWGSPNSLSTLDEDCPQSNPCTWDEVLALYPNAGIRDTGSPLAGLLLFKVGSGWASFDGNVDKFVIGIKTGSNTHTTTYDFESKIGEEPYAPSIGDVVLNEFLPRSANDDADKPNGEWVELYNNTDVAIDLTGWYVTDANGGPSNTVIINAANAESHLLPATTTIPAHGFLVVFMNRALLNNGGDTVKLFNASDVLQDSYEYGEDPTACENTPTPGEENVDDFEDICNASDVPVGKSFARFIDGIGPWIDPEPTPGEQNRFSREDLVAAGYSDAEIATLVALLATRGEYLIGEEPIVEPLALETLPLDETATTTATTTEETATSTATTTPETSSGGGTPTPPGNNAPAAEDPDGDGADLKDEDDDVDDGILDDEYDDDDQAQPSEKDKDLDQKGADDDQKPLGGSTEQQEEDKNGIGGTGGTEGGSDEGGGGSSHGNDGGEGGGDGSEGGDAAGDAGSKSAGGDATGSPSDTSNGGEG